MSKHPSTRVGICYINISAISCELHDEEKQENKLQTSERLDIHRMISTTCTICISITPSAAKLPSFLLLLGITLRHLYKHTAKNDLFPKELMTNMLTQTLTLFSSHSHCLMEMLGKYRHMMRTSRSCRNVISPVHSTVSPKYLTSATTHFKTSAFNPQTFNHGRKPSQ